MLVVKTWDGHDINDGTNYRAGLPGSSWGLPDVVIQSVKREGAWPVHGALDRNAAQINLFIAIEDSDNIQTLRIQLLNWFNPEDNIPKELIIEDSDGGNDRYIEAICQNLRPVSINTSFARDLFRATLVVSGDVRWRSTSETSDTWNLTASGQTNVIDNDGDDDVYPVYKLKPTAPKAAGFTYRRWVPIAWRSTNPTYEQKYPIRVTLDTASLTPAKMQADGDDLRVYSDGIEIRRYLNDMNTASTDIWFSLRFDRAPDLELKTAIAGAGAISVIEFEDETEVALLPDNGIILIGDEAFVYTSKSLINSSVSGVTREAKGTTAAAHGAGSTCHWIQHDVYIVYGNAALGDPANDDPYYNQEQPAFELDDSTNTEWHYEEFGDPDWPAGQKPGAWFNSPTGFNVSSNHHGCYNANHRTLDSDEHEVIGMWWGWGGPFNLRWTLMNPCGVVNAEWDGEKWAKDKDDYWGGVRYSGEYGLRVASIWQTMIYSCAADETWEAWSQGPEVSDWDEARFIDLVLFMSPTATEIPTVRGDEMYCALEASEVTLDLSATETPSASVGGEQGNYHLTGILENETTREKLELDFVLDLDSELEIDTYNKIVTWLEDGSRQFQAISLDSNRADWLKLQPGNNTLKYTESGLDTLTITTTYRERYY